MVSDDVQPANTVVSHPGRRRLTLAALAAIIVLGIFVRVYGIAGESVWFDEFTSLVFLKPPAAYVASPFFERWSQYTFHKDSPGLPAFLKQNRSIDPATMPVYDAIEYLWNRYVSSSFVGLRLLSVVIGVLILPVIFLLGRDIYGRNAGLVAALCVALSPIHRHFAQEIHMYGLMSLFAALSAYTFLRVVREGGRRWWVAHIAVNVLLVWTHSCGAILPMVEGGFLILFYFRRIRRNALWIGLHVLIAIPLALFFTTITFWSAEDTKEWQKIPTKREFIGDLLADDCTGLTYQMRATPGAWGLFVSPERAEAIVAAHWRIGRWMMGFFLLCAVWLAAANVWGGLRARRKQSEPPPWQWYVFLLMWWLGPALMLYLISITWRPIIFPRYTTHSSLALYVIIGGAVTSIPFGFRRTPVGTRARSRTVAGLAQLLAAAVVLLFYAYQQSLVIHGPQRTDWRSAGRFIRAETKPDDLVLVQDWMWKRVFVFNAGPLENVVSYAKTLDVLAEECAFFIALNKPSKSAEGALREVWVVIRTEYFDWGPSLEFEKQLARRNLAFDLEEFGGIQHVLVYRVWPEAGAARVRQLTSGLAEDAPKEFGDLAMEFWRVQEYDTAIAATDKAVEIAPNYSRAYSYKGMALKEKGDTDAAIAAFRKAVEIDPYDYLWSHVNLGMLLAEKGDFDAALESFRNALEQDPNYAWAYTNVGRAYMGKGDYDQAIAAFQKSIELDPNDLRGHDGLRDATAKKEGPPEGAQATPSPEIPPPPDVPGHAATTGPLESALPAESGSKTDDPLFTQGDALMAGQDYDGALAAFREILDRQPENALAYMRIATALLGKGDARGARMTFRKAFELDAGLRTAYEPLIAAMFETQNYDAARGEVERLRTNGRVVPSELLQMLERDSGRPQ